MILSSKSWLIINIIYSIIVNIRTIFNVNYFDMNHSSTHMPEGHNTPDKSPSNLDRLTSDLIAYTSRQGISKIIEKFEASTQLLPTEFAIHLINEWYAGDFLANEECIEFVIQNLEKFEESDHRKIALTLIEKVAYESGDDHKGGGEYVARNLEKFKKLNHKEISDKLIEYRYECEVAENLEKFEGLDHREIAMEIIDSGNGLLVAQNFEKFKNLDHKEMALILSTGEYVEDFILNLEKFEGLDHEEIAMEIIDWGAGWLVAQYYEKFEGLDQKEVVFKIIENMDNYDHPTALSIIENLEKFDELDHREIALKFIEHEPSSSVAWNLEKFKGLDHEEVAFKLIERGDGRSLIENLEKFKNLDHELITLKLIEDGMDNWRWLWKDIIPQLNKLKGVNPGILAKLKELSIQAWTSSYLEDITKE